MNHPKISIIGAPKAGTSAVHFWLSALDGVNPSTPKETFFFMDRGSPLANRDCNQSDHNIERYLEFYNGVQEGLTLDSTAHYFYQESALNHFRNIDTRVCVILRDPVRRIVSYYLYLKFTQAAFKVPMEFDRYVDLLLDSTSSLPESYFFHLRDHHALDRALDHGCYAKYLDRWSEKLGRENLLVVLFEDLTLDGNLVLARIGEHFGLNIQAKDLLSLKNENKTVNVRFPAANRIARSLGQFVPGERLRKSLRDIYLGVQSTSLPDLYVDCPEAIGRLVEYYAPHNRELAQLYGVDISRWG